MHALHRRTPSERLERICQYTETAIARYLAVFKPPPAVVAALVSVGDKLAASRGAIVGAQAAYREAVAATTAPRIEVRVIDLYADEVVRSIFRAAEESGPEVVASLFPHGVTPIVRPVGETEVSAIEALQRRVEALSEWSVGLSAIARLDEVLDVYRAALATRARSGRAAAEARYVRDTAREDLLDVLAAVRAQLRAVFPRDRARQSLFFDDVGPLADDFDDEARGPTS